MGWTLRIGEFEAEVDARLRAATPSVRYESEAEGSPMNSSGDWSNQCAPGYNAWHEFCDRVGLRDVFFAGADGQRECWVDHEDRARVGLILGSDACEALTEAHYLKFQFARDVWKGGPLEDGVDWDLRRLDWLVFWTRWALDNCEYPTFLAT